MASRSSFPVRISKNDTVGYLREAIKEKRNSALVGVDARELVLYCVSVHNKDNDTLKKIYQEIDQGCNSLTEPETTDTIEQTFPSPPPRHIHVLVMVPSVAQGQDYGSLYEELWGKAREFSGIKYFTLRIPQLQSLEPGYGFQPKPVSLRQFSLIGTSWESMEMAYKKLRTKNSMPDGMNCLLIRSEYERIERILQDAVSRKWSRAAKSGDPISGACLDFEVSGQPGIGKSYFLSYLLVRRLLNRQPTVYCASGRCFLFDKHSTGSLVDAAFLLGLAEDVKRKLWILTDGVLETPGWCRQDIPWFTVLAAPPNKGSFSRRWEEDRNIGVHYMKNWQWHEIFAAFSMENPRLRKEEIDSLYTAFVCFGPVARTCLKRIPARSDERGYTRCLKKYLDDLDWEIRDFFMNIGLDLEYAVSNSLHRMVLIHPSETSKSYTAQIATRWVAHRVAMGPVSMSEQMKFTFAGTGCRSSDGMDSASEDSTSGGSTSGGSASGDSDSEGSEDSDSEGSEDSSSEESAGEGDSGGGSAPEASARGKRVREESVSGESTPRESARGKRACRIARGESAGGESAGGESSHGGGTGGESSYGRNTRRKTTH